MSLAAKIAPTSPIGLEEGNFNGSRTTLPGQSFGSAYEESIAQFSIHVIGEVFTVREGNGEFSIIEFRILDVRMSGCKKHRYLSIIL